MITRRLATATTAVLLATVGGIAPVASARTANSDTCRAVSATKNGAPLDTSRVQLLGYCPLTSGTKTINWSIWNGPAPDENEAAPEGITNDLGAGSRNDTYTVTIDVGRFRPRITTTTGGDVSVRRQRLANRHWLVTIAGKPIRVTRGYCLDPDGKPVCTAHPEQQDEGILAGEISNLVDSGSKAERRAFHGLDYSTDVDQNFPPSIEKDSRGIRAIQVELGNSRYLHRPRTAEFRGFARMVIPDELLRLVYHVDPATLPARSWRFSLTGRGTQKVGLKRLDGAVQIDLTNLSFPDSRFRYFRLLLAKKN